MVPASYSTAYEGSDTLEISCFYSFNSPNLLSPNILLATFGSQNLTMNALPLEWETKFYFQIKQQALYNHFLKVYDNGWLIMVPTYK